MGILIKGKVRKTDYQIFLEVQVIDFKMEKNYEIKTTDGQIIRIKAVRGTNLFATRWYWDIYILEGFFCTSRHIASADDEALIPDAIRANISHVRSINPINR